MAATEGKIIASRTRAVLAIKRDRVSDFRRVGIRGCSDHRGRSERALGCFKHRLRENRKRDDAHTTDDCCKLRPR